ncbi:MAG: hypothetical protein H8E05_01180 [Bacteroidetes bacterium]|nr:hypothetical protein [Bacteroidota bacterium]
MDRLAHVEIVGVRKLGSVTNSFGACPASVYKLSDAQIEDAIADYETPGVGRPITDEIARKQIANSHRLNYLYGWDTLTDQSPIWNSLGTGTTSYRDKDGNEVEPVVCSPGDWILIESKKEPDYPMQQGSLVPTVIFGSGRTGNSYAGEYYDGYKSNSVKVINPYKILARVPQGAKTGPLHIRSTRMSSTWLGQKCKVDITKRYSVGDYVVGGKGDALDPIPIIIASDFSPICEEAYQVGLTNVDEIEHMTKPHGAIVSGGSSSLIGSNVFMGTPCHSKLYAKAGTHWSMGFTNNQYHFINAYAKEITFKVRLASTGGGYGAPIASIMAVLLLSSAMATAGPIGLAAAGIGVTMALGMIAVSAIYMSIPRGPSGGSAKFRLHRSVDEYSQSYRKSVSDVCMASDGQFGRVFFAKHYKRSTRGNVKPLVYIDFARSKYVTDNLLHESIAWGHNGDALNLNCTGNISILNYDGTQNRTYQPHDNPGGLKECTYNDSDGWWRDANGNLIEWPRGQTPKSSHYAQNAEWVNASDNYTGPARADHRGDKVGTPSIFGGMTPMSSPPFMRNISYEATIQKHMPPQAELHNNYDHTVSEGLAMGGALWFPLIYAKAMGRGQIMTVSNWTYSLDRRCITCDATAYGQNARYCMRNENPLGFGGWYLGEKCEPWFNSEMFEYRNRNAFAVSSMMTKVRYTGHDLSEIVYPHGSLGKVFSNHENPNGYTDRTKWEAGWQYGGWPVNFLNAAGAYERQPGGQCWAEQVWQNKDNVGAHHPFALDASDKKIGEKTGDEPKVEGHGFEYWDSAAIPTYVKPINDSLSSFFGDANKYKKSKSEGKLKLTERIDLIKIVGTMKTDDFYNEKWDEVIPVGPHHEFQGGDVVVLRMHPNTTKSSVPSKAVAMRKLTTSYKELDGNGDEQIKEIPIAGLGSFNVEVDNGIMHDSTPSIFDFYSVGSKDGKKGLATLIMEGNDDLGFSSSLENGEQGRLPQCNLPNIEKGDQLLMEAGELPNRKKLRRIIAGSLGKPIDDDENPTQDQPYIDGWNQILKTESDTYSHYMEDVPLRFDELRRITYGRNGKEIEFYAEVNRGMQNPNIISLEVQTFNVNSGELETKVWTLSEISARKDFLDTTLIPRLKNRIANLMGWTNIYDYFNSESIDSSSLDRDQYWLLSVGISEDGTTKGDIGVEKEVEHLRGAMEELDKLEKVTQFPPPAIQSFSSVQGQQLAFKLPFGIASGGGMTWDDNGLIRALTNEYIWLYFEEADQYPTQGFPQDTTPPGPPLGNGPGLPVRQQEYYRYNSYCRSSTYFSLCVPLNMADSMKSRRNHRNTFSQVWSTPDTVVKQSQLKCPPDAPPNP